MVAQLPQYTNLTERDCYYFLMNIESHPNFLPMARGLVQEYLRTTRAKLDNTAELPETLHRFEFSHKALEERLNRIFIDRSTEADHILKRDTDKSRKYFEFWTRDRLRERLIQFAPFNLTDGAWLQNITRVGPINRAQSRLFAIWADEVGNGLESQNHSNVYQSLLTSISVYLPDPHSREFANNKLLLDSAFSSPVFQMAISQFSSLFLPEIIGITLNIEWNASPELRTVISVLQENKYDPHFYTLHVAIDNPVRGHGALAKEIVGLYLDEVRKHGGEDAVQKEWSRIWDGYVAFETTGTLGEDLRSRIENPPSLREEVIELIRIYANKAHLMHGDKKIIDPNTRDAKPINQFFENPEHLLDALVANNYFIPGKPDESSFFRLLDFDGRMYKVFSNEEIALMKRWVSSLDVRPALSKDRGPGRDMERVLRELRDIAKNVDSHKNLSLKGPDPRNPSQLREESVAWWFDADNASTAQLMAALASDERYVKAPYPEESPLLTTYLTSGRPMANRVGHDNIEVIKRWISAGMPQPEEDEEGAVFAIFLDAELPEDVEPRRRILGMGTVH